MKTKILQWLAIVVIFEIGLLHLMMAQAEYEEAAYMGYLFAANFFGALLAAYAIYRKQVWGWWLGLAIVAGSMAGYAWSRTLGMPGMNVEEWFTPYGIVAMFLEAGFVLLVILRPWKTAATQPQGAIHLKHILPVFALLAILSVSALPFYPYGVIAVGLEAALLVLLIANPWKTQRLDNLPSIPMKYILPVVALCAVVSISFGAYRWDAAAAELFGLHVGTLSQVLDTPAATQSEIAEKYGVQISLVANSMMNSIVDVRLKIVDPAKAHALLQNQAAILVDQQALILAPHMHSHTMTRLKAGKNFIMFFPTQKIISQGTPVSLVFGSVRFEPVLVR